MIIFTCGNVSARDSELNALRNEAAKIELQANYIASWVSKANWIRYILKSNVISSSQQILPWYSFLQIGNLFVGQGDD